MTKLNLTVQAEVEEVLSEIIGDPVFHWTGEEVKKLERIHPWLDKGKKWALMVVAFTLLQVVLLSCLFGLSQLSLDTQGVFVWFIILGFVVFYVSILDVFWVLYIVFGVFGKVGEWSRQRKERRTAADVSENGVE